MTPVQLDPVLIEAKRLYDLGFAVIWLKPKSKAPVESKWTTGPRKDWEDLTRLYHSGLNMGVRLGAPSKLGSSYLAVVDIDVKSTDKKHQLEVDKALTELFPDLPRNTVEVISGRGNGSRHIYIVTPKPAQPAKYRSSKEVVKTLMPSAAINQKQKDGLTAAELKKGLRLRPAWEISVMGEGQQVVLPPSTHPDTGRAYAWKLRPDKTRELPELKLGHKPKSEERTTTQDWKPVDYDLARSGLPQALIDTILHAQVENRSDALLFVAKDLLSEGLNVKQIMSILTDQSYELGKVAFDHAKTESRERAANWLFNYTIKKAQKEIKEALTFDDAVETVLLSTEDATKQALEILPPAAPVKWTDKLDKTLKGKLLPTLNNAFLILENTLGSVVFKRDTFALSDMYGMNTPWGGKVNEPITDDEVLKLKMWFIHKHRLELSNNILGDAVGFISIRNAFHPVRDYLDTLTWDGVPRLDTWLKVYLKANMPEPYLSAVSRKTLCAMVARIYQPGIKFDHVLILNGPQGIGKSTAAQILASPPWFIDRLPDLRDKDSMLNLQGIWVAEMGELANMRTSSVETYKAFLSSQVDKFRLPYGHRRQDFKRQCIIIGSSNPKEFLNDPTGNRRFWPVTVKQCAFAALARDRDQLLAEAKFVWRDLDEPLYLNPEEEAQAITVQGTHTNDDVDHYLEQKLEEYLEEHAAKNEFPLSKFKLESLFKMGGVFEHLGFSKDAKRVAKLLRNHNFVNERIGGGQKWWFLKGSKECETRIANQEKHGLQKEH